MFQPNTITDQYLIKVYDDFQMEHSRLLSEMKNLGENDTPSKDKDIQKQLQLINVIIMGVLKFRNVKKEILKKANL